MKKFMLVISLIFFVTINFAQTYSENFAGENKVYFTYEDAMTDSVGNYYSDVVDVKDISPSATFIPINWIHASTEGAVSITTTLEGRAFDPVNGSYTAWVVVDSIAAASSTETLQFSAAGLAGGERPDQVRLKFDGQAGNRNDTTIKAWVTVPHDN